MLNNSNLQSLPLYIYIYMYVLVFRSFYSHKDQEIEINSWIRQSAKPNMASSAPCNKSFCTNYLLLEPEKASVLDLCKLLFSSNVEKRKFVDCPDGVREPFGRRWIMFVSVVMQKLLQATSKPLAGFGNGVENWLNLLSGNGGFFGLIMNSFKGIYIVIIIIGLHESFLSILILLRLLLLMVVVRGLRRSWLIVN